jgi:hypothetical protein
VEAAWITSTVALGVAEGDEMGIRYLEDITRPPCHKGKYIYRPSPPGWGLDVRSMNFFWENNY